jgi:hypothetical protein
MDDLGAACALLLAATFVRAAAAKLARPSSTAASFAALGLSGSPALARAVPVVELGVAVTLVAGPRPGAVAALVLLVGFSVVLARALRAGATAPCNCFGSARADPVSSVDLVRNGLLAGLAAAGLTTAGPAVPGPVPTAMAVAAFAGGWLLLAALRRRSTA